MANVYGVLAAKGNFDFSSLKTLAATAEEPVKQPAVGQYFRENFPSYRVRGKGGNIYLENSEININSLSLFVRKIVIKDGDLKIFQPNRFWSLKEIEFSRGQLFHTEYAKNVLGNVETLKFIDCKFNDDFNDTFLSHCDNLKRLYVKEQSDARSDAIVGYSNIWLVRKYPNLEHFELESRRSIGEVILFLFKNQNIRTFSTTIEFLIENMYNLLPANIKLNVLSILHANSSVSMTEFNEFVQNLTYLHTLKRYKYLHLYYSKNQMHYHYPQNLLQFVTILYAAKELHVLQLSAMLNLQELYLLHSSQIGDFDATLMNLQKLDYIYFLHDAIENILPFIVNLPNLKKIRIDLLRNGQYFDNRDNIVNLNVLNVVRGMCTHAHKLTIYVTEEIYLATKFAFKQIETNLIDIRRHESFDGIQDFSFV